MPPETTDADLAAKKEWLSTVPMLSLKSTLITDAGLVHLQGFTKLKYLDLSLTQITDVGLAHLKGLSNLETLNLNHNRVTDVGLAHL